MLSTEIDCTDMSDSEFEALLHPTIDAEGKPEPTPGYSRPRSLPCELPPCVGFSNFGVPMDSFLVNEYRLEALRRVRLGPALL